jgi:hypothetical protein
MSAPIPLVDPLQTIIDSAADLQTELAIFDTHRDWAADDLPRFDPPSSTRCCETGGPRSRSLPASLAISLAGGYPCASCAALARRCAIALTASVTAS